MRHAGLYRIYHKEFEVRLMSGMQRVHKVPLKETGSYEISVETYLNYESWRSLHGVLFETYPEEFDLEFIYKDIALATFLLGLPVPLDVLPEYSRPNEKRWSLMDRVMYRIIHFNGWPRTYGSVVKEFEMLKVPHTLSNYALALAPVLMDGEHEETKSAQMSLGF